MSFLLGLAGMLSSLFLFFWAGEQVSTAGKSYIFLMLASLFLFIACATYSWEDVFDKRRGRNK